MERGKKLIVIAHCIMNGNAKVGGICTYAGGMKEVVACLMDNDLGIYQLPCPEMQMLGCRRWGHVKEQLDTPLFRTACSKMLADSIMQLRDYCANGYTVLGVIGIDGSPSCGVHTTCSSPHWQGDFIDHESTREKIDSLQMIPSQGVFIEELEKMFMDAGLKIPFTAVDESDYTQSIQTLQDWISRSMERVEQ